MRSAKYLLMSLVPLVAVSACTTLSDQDRALLTSASENAQAAKDQAAQAAKTAQEALDAANAAKTSADASAKSAADSADAAKAASEKCDRMFSKSLRK